MRYPQWLHGKLEEIENIVTQWPVTISFDDVLKWILQFDTDDYELAVRVLRNLNVIGHDDMNDALSVAYSKLNRKAIDKGARLTNRNTLFAGIGEAGKSGSMIGYHFRLTNEISEENFIGDDTQRLLEEGRIDNIVLLDDMIGTGRQATEELEELTNKIAPLGVKNIFLLTVCGMREAINKLNETNVHAFSAFEYDKGDTVISLDGPFYNSVPYDERQKLYERLKYYGEKCSRNMGLGYGGIGTLIAFHYNCFRQDQTEPQ